MVPDTAGLPSDSDTGTASASTGDSGETTAPPSCSGTDVCLAPVSGWSGPVAVSDEAKCPSIYATEIDLVNAGLTAPEAQCLCGCVVNSVTCQLQVTDDRLGGVLDFSPSQACDSPPLTDACLLATPQASCTPNPSGVVPPLSWAETVRVCEGDTPTETCDGGLCFPAADRLCVVRDGEHDCPTAYSEKSAYHRSVKDTRACTACTCEPVDQACTIETEICSVGFYDETVKSGDGQLDHCLNSSDGDGVTILSSAVDDDGTCDTDGGKPDGEALEQGLVTVCCTP